MTSDDPVPPQVRFVQWVQERQMRLALAIAGVEALLYAAHVLTFWSTAGLATVALGVWWYARRGSAELLGPFAWIFATSQVLVLLTPVALSAAKLMFVTLLILLVVGGAIWLLLASSSGARVGSTSVDDARRGSTEHTRRA